LDSGAGAGVVGEINLAYESVYHRAHRGTEEKLIFHALSPVEKINIAR
jgi:hypothetical protein